MSPKITLMFNQSWDASYCKMVLLLFELGNYVARNVECVRLRKSRFFVTLFSQEVIPKLLADCVRKLDHVIRHDLQICFF